MTLFFSRKTLNTLFTSVYRAQHQLTFFAGAGYSGTTCGLGAEPRPGNSSLSSTITMPAVREAAFFFLGAGLELADFVTAAGAPDKDGKSNAESTSMEDCSGTDVSWSEAEMAREISISSLKNVSYD